MAIEWLDLPIAWLEWTGIHITGCGKSLAIPER